MARAVIPNGAWTAVNVDGQTVWVYHFAGQNVTMELSLDEPTLSLDKKDSVQHKNVFEKNE